MTACGHLIFALSSAIFAKKIELSSTLAQGVWGHVVIGGILSSLIPDIDHPKSFLGQRLKWLSVPISKIFGHRGITHSLLAITACYIFICSSLSPQTIIINVPADFIHAMIVGYISHIIADMLTPAGVPLLWPYRRRFSIPILGSNKYFLRREQIFCLFMLACALIYPINISMNNQLLISHFIQKIRQLIYGFLTYN